MFDLLSEALNEPHMQMKAAKVLQQNFSADVFASALLQLIAKSPSADEKQSFLSFLRTFAKTLSKEEYNNIATLVIDTLAPCDLSSKISSKELALHLLSSFLLYPLTDPTPLETLLSSLVLDEPSVAKLAVCLASVHCFVRVVASTTLTYSDEKDLLEMTVLFFNSITSSVVMTDDVLQVLVDLSSSVFMTVRQRFFSCLVGKLDVFLNSLSFKFIVNLFKTSLALNDDTCHPIINYLILNTPSNFCFQILTDFIHPTESIFVEFATFQFFK
ncbi:hypothetical protein GEMRC1_005081 [Eukaryota sp. GEM-RC1]